MSIHDVGISAGLSIHLSPSPKVPLMQARVMKKTQSSFVIVIARERERERERGGREGDN